MGAGASFRCVDAHYHIYDSAKQPNPTSSDLQGQLPSYSQLDYDADCGIGVAGSVFVETVAGQAEGKASLDPVAEITHVVEQIGEERAKNVNIVAYINLSRPIEAEATIQALQSRAGSRFVGVRQILCYSAEQDKYTWPNVDRSFLADPEFREGFALLQKHSLSFDLQVNWFQLTEAAAFLKDFPTTPIILDHLGLINLNNIQAEEMDSRLSVWRKGMQELAALPNVTVKASMLWYIQRQWQHDEGQRDVVKKLVREIIELFSPDRVMFASNFPVDKLETQTSLEALVTAQHNLVEDFPEEQRRKLFRENAARVYKLENLAEG